jgi:hypothetical protein
MGNIFLFLVAFMIVFILMGTGTILLAILAGLIGSL